MMLEECPCLIESHHPKSPDTFSITWNKSKNTLHGLLVGEVSSCHCSGSRKMNARVAL